jgi:hypothetical protein
MDDDIQHENETVGIAVGSNHTNTKVRSTPPIECRSPNTIIRQSTQENSPNHGQERKSSFGNRG